jgi:hypothetical protein
LPNRGAHALATRKQWKLRLFYKFARSHSFPANILHQPRPTKLTKHEGSRCYCAGSLSSNVAVVGISEDLHSVQAILSQCLQGCPRRIFRDTGSRAQHYC